MKILILGASGTLGRPLQAHLYRQGHDVIGVSRTPSRLPTIRWEAIKDHTPDAVINLAGASIADHMWTRAYKRELLDSRLWALKQLTGKRIPILISASAIGYYLASNNPMDEDSVPGSDFLSRLCQAWEQAAYELHAERTVILRLGVVLTRTGGAFPRMKEPYLYGLAPDLGNNAFSFLHIDDFLGIIDHCLSSSISGPINACAATTQKALLKAFQRSYTTLRIPLSPFLQLSERASILDAHAVSSKRLDYTWRYPTIESALEDLLQEPEARVFQYETLLPTTLEKAYEFFSEPKNLEKITPPQIRVLDNRIILFGIPLTWKGKIVASSINATHASIIDVQLKGPFGLWHHTHALERTSHGILLTDTILYKERIPFTACGINYALLKIFQYRQKKLDEIFQQKALEYKN